MFTTYAIPTVGTILGGFACWNWILDETVGDPFPYLLPLLFVLAPLVLGGTINVIIGRGLDSDTGIKPAITSEMVQALNHQYEEFQKSLANPETKDQTISNYILTIDILMANLVLASWYAGRPLTGKTFDNVISTATVLSGAEGVALTSERLKGLVNLILRSDGKPPQVVLEPKIQG